MKKAEAESGTIVAKIKRQKQSLVSKEDFEEWGGNMSAAVKWSIQKHLFDFMANCNGGRPYC